MLRLIWRLLLGSFALMLAIPFGSFVLGAGILADPTLRGLVGSFVRAGITSGFWDLVTTFSPDGVIEATLAFAKAVLVVLTVPPCLAALIGETLRFRAAAWYGGFSGLLTASLPWIAHGGPKFPADPMAASGEGRLATMLFLAGAASGLVYWAIAGWSAGFRARRKTPRALELPAPEEIEPPALSAPVRTAQN